MVYLPTFYPLRKPLKVENTMFIKNIMLHPIQYRYVKNILQAPHMFSIYLPLKLTKNSREAAHPNWKV